MTKRDSNPKLYEMVESVRKMLPEPYSIEWDGVPHGYIFYLFPNSDEDAIWHAESDYSTRSIRRALYGLFEYVFYDREERRRAAEKYASLWSRENEGDLDTLEKREAYLALPAVRRWLDEVMPDVWRTEVEAAIRDGTSWESPMTDGGDGWWRSCEEHESGHDYFIADKFEVSPDYGGRLVHTFDSGDEDGWDHYESCDVANPYYDAWLAQFGPDAWFDSWAPYYLRMLQTGADPLHQVYGERSVKERKQIARRHFEDWADIPRLVRRLRNNESMEEQ
jgi:hypothetical protein